VEADAAHGHGLTEQQTHTFFAIGGRQPTECPLLTLTQADPVLDARRFQGVKKVLRLERQIRFEDEDGFAVAEDWDGPDR